MKIQFTLLKNSSQIQGVKEKLYWWNKNVFLGKKQNQKYSHNRPQGTALRKSVRSTSIFESHLRIGKKKFQESRSANYI